MVSHLTFSDKLEALYYDFTSGEARAVSYNSYRLEVGIISAACKIESNCGTQYNQGGGMVPGKPEDQKSYQGELGRELGVMCAIKIMDSNLGSTALVVNSCDKISALG